MYMVLAYIKVTATAFCHFLGEKLKVKLFGKVTADLSSAENMISVV